MNDPVRDLLYWKITQLDNDLSGDKPLLERDYQLFLMSRKHLPDVFETSTYMSSDAHAGEMVDEIVRASHEELESVEKINPSIELFNEMGSFISSAFFLLRVPFVCFREGRTPTANEWLKFGVCFAGLALFTLATGGVGGLIGVSIITILGATVSFTKPFLNERLKLEAFNDATSLAKHTRFEIETLTNEIDALTLRIDGSEPSLEDNAVYLKKVKALSDHVSQYMDEAYKANRLRKEFHCPRNEGLRDFHKACGFMFLLGVILTVVAATAPFSLPILAGIGAGILFVSAGASLVSMVVGRVVTWREARRERLALNPETVQAILTKQQAPKTSTEQRLVDLVSIVKTFKQTKTDSENSTAHIDEALGVVAPNVLLTPAKNAPEKTVFVEKEVTSERPTIRPVNTNTPTEAPQATYEPETREIVILPSPLAAKPKETNNGTEEDDSDTEEIKPQE